MLIQYHLSSVSYRLRLFLVLLSPSPGVWYVTDNDDDVFPIFPLSNILVTSFGEIIPCVQNVMSWRFSDIMAYYGVLHLSFLHFFLPKRGYLFWSPPSLIILWWRWLPNKLSFLLYYYSLLSFPINMTQICHSLVDLSVCHFLCRFITQYCISLVISLFSVHKFMFEVMHGISYITPAVLNIPDIYNNITRIMFQSSSKN